MSERTGIAPPHNLEAERATLGAILLAPTLLQAVHDEGLHRACFYRTTHRIIYAAMQAMNTNNQHIDVLTLSAFLRGHGRLDAVGGRAAIDELTGGVPNLAGIREYARIVVSEWRWRERLIAAYEQQAAIAARDEAAYMVAVRRAEAVAFVAPVRPCVEPAARELRDVTSSREAA